jgi:ribonuclease HI
MRSSRWCEVYVDGASRGNPGPAGVGVVFMDGRARPIRTFARYIGETTNNVAEYLALLYAMQEAVLAGYTRLKVKTDSELLARQFSGQYQVRDSHLRLFHDLILHLARGLADCRVEHIPRTQNTVADRLATQAAKRNTTAQDRVKERPNRDNSRRRC